MEDYEKEYEEALKRLTETKEKVAAGNKTIDDLGEAIEEVRFLKKKEECCVKQIILSSKVLK